MQQPPESPGPGSNQPLNNQPPYPPQYPNQPPYPPPGASQPYYPPPGQYPGQPPYQGQPLPYQPVPQAQRNRGCIIAAIIAAIIFIVIPAITVAVLVLLGPQIQDTLIKSVGPVSKVEMARSFQDFPAKAVDVTTTFRPTDTPLHCVVSLFPKTSVGTAVRADWFTIKEGTEQEDLIKSTNYTTDGQKNIIDFSLTYSGKWPVGSYRVDVYVNNVKSQSAYFRVA